MKTNNTSGSIEELTDISEYGIPDFGDITKCCHLLFFIHNYGFAFIDLVGYFYGISIVIKYRKTIFKQRIVLAILVLTLSSEICSAIFLLVDPYGFSHRLPSVILGIMWKFSDTIILWNYFLFHLFTSKQTRLHISKFEFKNHNLSWTCCLIETTIVIVCEIISCFRIASFSLSVFSDVVFAVIAFLLISHFIYGAPQLSNYVRETKKARKSFSEFSVSKKLELSQSQSVDSSSNQKRLQFPKIKRSANSLRKISLINYSESSLIEEKSVLDGGQNIATSLVVKRPTSLNIIPTLGAGITNSHDKTKIEDIDSNSEITSTEKHFELETSLGDINIEISLKANKMCNTTLKPFSDVQFNNHGSVSTYVPKSQRYNTSVKSSKGSDEQINSRNLQNDQGYLADSECTSNLSNESTNSAKNSCDYLKILPTAAPSKSSDLPVSVSFLSLYRVRQHKMLQRILKVCYFQTFSLGMLIICKVYIIFSEYGGLFYTTNLQPMTWLIFQSLYR